MKKPCLSMRHNDQTKEIVDACAPQAGEAVAVGVQMAGHAFAKGGKALNAAKPSSAWKEYVGKAINATKPHVEEGVAHGKELGKIGIAKGKEYGSKAINAAKPHVEEGKRVW
eukprot:g10121.t1